MVDGHTVTQHTTDELGIVPVFGIELLGESLDGGLVAALVLKLEVVAALAVLVNVLDNLSLGDCLRKHDTLFIILQAGEYLVGIAIEQSDECHPLLLVVLESHNVAVEDMRAYLCDLGTLARSFGSVAVLLVFLLRH